MNIWLIILWSLGTMTSFITHRYCCIGTGIKDKPGHYLVLIIIWPFYLFEDGLLMTKEAFRYFLKI